MDTGSAATDGPLTGLRVLELGQLIAGPYCGQVLGDFGADVIKVEIPEVGDPMRLWGVIHQGRSLSWAVIARNKRSVTADLRTSEGRELLLRLADEADVIVENFRPGTLERLGLGWDVLHARAPRVTLVRISGYGQDGPYAHRAGFGSIGEAMGGLRHLTGEPDRAPSRTGLSLGDMLAGLHGVVGALLALRAREQTGEGQVVDVSIYESVLAMTEALVPEYALTGRVRERTGSVLPGVAPSNVYPTADDSYVLIAANQDRVFRRLCEAMGRADLADDPRYAEHTARGLHQAELDELISAWTATLQSADLLEAMDEHGVPAGTVYTAADMVADPQFLHRESIVEVPDPVLGPVPMQNVAPHLSSSPGRIRWTGPDLGAHDAQVRDELDERADRG